MIRSNTVFVVGAGASFELRFPLGDTLLAEIGKALDISPGQYDGRVSGDQRIWDEIRRKAREGGARTND